MTVKLYTSPLACSAAAHLVLLELDLPHTLELADIYAQPHVLLRDGAVYRERNRKDSVPALELETGELVTEVSVIMTLLCDRRPDSPLLPRPGTLARYRVMEWLSYVGSEIHKTIGPLFAPAMPEAGKELHRRNLHRRLAFVEESLAAAPYLAGPELTIADLYLFVMIGWQPYFKVDLRPYPRLQRYQARIAERPSFFTMQEAIAPALERMKLPDFPVFA